MAWKQLAIDQAVAFAAKMIVGFIVVFASSAAHADTVYNYTGNTLPLFFHLLPVTCPAAFGKITTSVHYPNTGNPYPDLYCGAKGGYVGAPFIVSNTFSVDSSGKVTNAYVECTHIGPTGTADKISYVISATGDQYVDYTPGPGGCTYKNTSPGVWSGPISAGPAKQLGQTSDNTNCPSAPPPTKEGNPIDAATGNKVQTEADVVCGQHTGLSLVRTYNSQDFGISAFGARWRDHGIAA